MIMKKKRQDKPWEKCWAGRNSEDGIIRGEMDEDIDNKRKWWGMGRKVT